VSVDIHGPGSIRGIASTDPSPRRQPVRTGPGFEASLDRLLDPSPEETAPRVRELAVQQPVVLSRHARARLASRGIDFGPAEQAELEGALDTLDGRGAKKALVVSGEHAWIVGVPRRTVITVMSREEALGQVFTDLDATYLAG